SSRSAPRSDVLSIRDRRAASGPPFFVSTARRKAHAAELAQRLDADCHGDEDAIGPLLDHRNSLGAGAARDAVAFVAGPARAACIVGRVRRIDPVRRLVRKEELAGQDGRFAQEDLEMNVRRAPRIPAGIDRRELDEARVVAKLGAAHEALAARVEPAGLVRIARIDALGIAMPDVDAGAGDRLAGLVDDQEAEAHGPSGAPLSHVDALE